MSGPDVAVATVEPEQETVRKSRPKKQDKPRRQPRYNVVLWDDDHHTYEYVIVMMMDLFGHSPEKSYKLAQEVDLAGRAIVLTTTKEHAELKRDQIHAYGKDFYIKASKGSMSATIEPFYE